MVVSGRTLGKTRDGLLLLTNRIGGLMRGAKYIAAAGILTLLLGSQVGRAQQSTAPLTNQDVIAMTQSGLAESVILSAIRTNDTAFDVSASGLIALKKANVTVNVMQEMLNAANAKKIGTAS